MSELNSFSLNRAKELLLHVCCAPCAVWPVKSLLAQYPKLKLILWFYNPNVQPLAEFRRRRDGLAYLVARWEEGRERLFTDFSPAYDQGEFLAMAAKFPEQPSRCLGCYEIRLSAAAKAAKDKGIEYFSTTLLFSRRQKSELILEAGRKAETLGVKFYDEDFRVGWTEGNAMAKAFGLYRQNFCGCVYGALEQGQ
jgi:predicted adenine nucleotide alpha hydrolase (AANH) superfamily ATPase